ncbi:MAG TPA: hypothetical protein VFH45_11565, partial [Acidimicrobiales bacterium]|nr:hypothetical protein [Acidimicrobiales bacterium]
MPGKPRPWVARVVAGVVAGAVLTLMALAQMRVHDRVSHAAEVNLDTRTSASAAFLSRYWAAVVGPGGGDVTAALDAYLKTTLPASVGRAYLVDGDGDLLATSGATRGTGAAGTLAAADGALARASASAPCGSYRAADGASFYSS